MKFARIAQTLPVCTRIEAEYENQGKLTTGAQPRASGSWEEAEAESSSEGKTRSQKRSPCSGFPASVLIAPG